MKTTWVASEASRQLPSVLGLGLVTLPVPLHRSQRRGKTSSHLRSSSASVRSRMPLPAQSGHSVVSASMTHLQFVRDRHNFAPGLVGLAERQWMLGIAGGCSARMLLAIDLSPGHPAIAGVAGSEVAPIGSAGIFGMRDP